MILITGAACVSEKAVFVVAAFVGVEKLWRNAVSSRASKVRAPIQCGLAVVILAALPLVPAAAQDLAWMRQAGSAGSDFAQAVAVDGDGNAYITGYSTGNLGGPNAGGHDIFLAKYDAAGVQQWVQHAGTAGDDRGSGVAVDRDGNAYITGYTSGDLGGPSAGSSDIFLAKYNPSGIRLWIVQAGSAGSDQAAGVAVDAAGNAYVTGRTLGNLDGPNTGSWDVFLAKYDASGSRLWMRQIGSTATDNASGVAVDAVGNAYITGSTFGSLGGPTAGNTDIFLAKYDASGTQLWIRQTGSAYTETVFAVAVDSSGNAYITGNTSGSIFEPGTGVIDIFLVNYDASGALLWTRQFGSAGADYACGIAVDGAGNPYITGFTDGSLGGPSAGYLDVYLAKCDPSGNELWFRQIGTALYDRAYGVALDAVGNAYITGSTAGTLGGTSVGGIDLFLAKYGPPPCGSIADIAGGTGGFGADGIVDGSDYVVFINSFGIGSWATDALADVNGDGMIDGSDFIAFIDAFAAGC